MNPILKRNGLAFCQKSSSDSVPALDGQRAISSGVARFFAESVGNFGFGPARILRLRGKVFCDSSRVCKS